MRHAAPESWGRPGSPGDWETPIGPVVGSLRALQTEVEVETESCDRERGLDGSKSLSGACGDALCEPRRYDQHDARAYTHGGGGSSRAHAAVVVLVAILCAGCCVLSHVSVLLGVDRYVPCGGLPQPGSRHQKLESHGGRRKGQLQCDHGHVRSVREATLAASEANL